MNMSISGRKALSLLTIVCFCGLLELAVLPVPVRACGAAAADRSAEHDEQPNYVVMESASHGAGKKARSLLPWIVGGGVVLAALLVLLLTKKSGDAVTVEEFGGHGTTDGLFDDPSGIALDDDGNVYVSDRDNRRIQKFTANGKFIKKWGFTPGLYPHGLVVDGGRLFVCDVNTSGSNLQIFDLEGNHQAAWKVPDFNVLSGSPAAVDVDADGSGNLYVLDNINRVVVVYNAVGTVSGHFRVDRDNPWPGPNGIAVAGNQVFVAESSDNQYGNRINVFTTSGAFVRTWGSPGSGAGQFRNPIGIALMGGASLIVGDHNVAPTFARIQKFDLGGGYQGVIQPASGSFYAKALAVNEPAGKIYVCAGNNDTILVVDTF
ncbi:MAG: NHL repeat-containing protein [Candidatus Aminicenantes bacterium]|nr:NHL repeat-containing protein [Candidatus Aminicenantes bacterium]